MSDTTVSTLGNKRVLAYLASGLLGLSVIFFAVLIYAKHVREIKEWPVPPLTASDYDWTVLFDGETLDGWRRYGQPQPGPVWSVDNGAITVAPLRWSPSRILNAGALITEKQYTNFELELEWKVSPGANSGLHFGVRESGEFWAAFQTGIEIQILDDEGHADGQNTLTSAGSIFSLYPAPEAATLPVGKFNKLRLRVIDGQVTSWLNGKLASNFRIGSKDWQDRKAASRFAASEHYAKYGTGHIALQDHGNQVWFRNIKIREIAVAMSN